MTESEPRPQVRGFALYVGIDETTAAAHDLKLTDIVGALKRATNDMVPYSDTYAAVAFAPSGSSGRNIDLVRLALQEPSAVAKFRDEEPEPSDGDGGVVIDLSRKRVLIDYQGAPLTYKEFELLQYLVENESETISRQQIVDALWHEGDVDIPNERTIDVHVRRLRGKLGRFGDIVRTVRGIGYRFDQHADVSVLRNQS